MLGSSNPIGGDGAVAELSPRAPIKACPVCRLAMLASKSNKDAPHYDTFKCLNCGCVISTGHDQSDPDKP
jgi:hypothetical protein